MLSGVNRSDVLVFISCEWLAVTTEFCPDVVDGWIMVVAMMRGIINKALLKRNRYKNMIINQYQLKW